MNFTSKFKIFFTISLIIIALGVIMGFVQGGLNLGIDFTGGSLTTIDIHESYDDAVIDETLESFGITDAPHVKSGETGIIIRMQDMGGDEEQTQLIGDIVEKLQETYPEAKLEGVDRVGGVASAELVRNALLAVVVACGLMLIYIWIRFELFSGIAAVIALVHDVLIMIAIVSIFNIPINSGFIAACLTIIGYSINNTIVIFDRIRDNRKLMSRKDFTNADITNKSISQTLSRTINTSVTTLIMIVCLYIFGVDSIKEFSLPIIVGLLAGTYSSVFLSGPIWSLMLTRSEKNKPVGGKKSSNGKNGGKAKKKAANA